MRLWRNAGLDGGKYLVTGVGSGGLPLPCPHMVWSARDPAAPAGLRAYAEAAEQQGLGGTVGAWVRLAQAAEALDLLTFGFGMPLPASSPSKDRPYLVRRRDGSTPLWPWEVMQARDPCAPTALRAYADAAAALGFDASYVADVRQLADAFEAWRAEHRPEGSPTSFETRAYAEGVRRSADAFDAYRAAHGPGVPDAAPERAEDPAVVALLAGGTGA